MSDVSRLFRLNSYTKELWNELYKIRENGKNPFLHFHIHCDILNKIVKLEKTLRISIKLIARILPKLKNTLGISFDHKLKLYEGIIKMEHSIRLDILQLEEISKTMRKEI